MPKHQQNTRCLLTALRLLDPLLLGLQARLVIGKGALPRCLITEQPAQALQVGLQAVQLGPRAKALDAHASRRQLLEHRRRAHLLAA